MSSDSDDPRRHHEGLEAMTPQEHHPESAARRFVAEAQERADKATDGPWGWWCNVRSKQVYLATQLWGRRYVMTFRRFGMSGAQPEFQVPPGIMESASKLGTPDYNGDVRIEHPDAAFIAAARADVPRLAAMLKVAMEALSVIASDTGTLAGNQASYALAELERLAEDGER